MITICQRCGLSLTGEQQHATFDECFVAMKDRLGRIGRTFTVAATSIATCRAKKHGGKPTVAKLDICVDCLGSGYSAYQVAREMQLSGRTPQ